VSTFSGRTVSADLSQDGGGGTGQRPPARVVVLISGRGSNMAALVEHAHIGDAEKIGTSKSTGHTPGNYSVARVITDNPSASGLTWAQGRGIDTIVLPDRSSFGSKREYFSHLLHHVVEVQPDVVCLAGFMKVLPPDVIEPLFPRIINIHPSLLPAFPGLNTHERALAEGVIQHGCSIHIVVPEIDAGPLIAQAVVKIRPEDSPRSLSDRVLEKEHQLYPWVVSLICHGDITLGETVSFSEFARTDALSRGYLLSPGFALGSSATEQPALIHKRSV
jgi:phosphoribosylglycinamide formyltransferase-1